MSLGNSSGGHSRCHKMEIPGGGGGLQKNLSMVEVCIYSGTTHLNFYELILPDIFSYI